MFVRDKNRWLWVPKAKSKQEVINEKPNSPAKVKRLNGDKKAAEIARREPHTGRQTILERQGFKEGIVKS